MNISNDFKDLVSWVDANNVQWSGDMLDLDDDFKDDICYHWLRLHPTWLDDIFPHTVSDEALLVLDLAYGVGLFADSGDVGLADVFYNATLRLKEIDEDVYWSEALGNFESILSDKVFGQEVRDRIYMYLEPSLREEVQEIFDDNLLAASQGANLH